MAETSAYRRYSGVDPELLTPEYHSTLLRAPTRPLTVIPQTLSELTGPAFGHAPFGELDHDLTRQHSGEPLGERIVLSGRVLDGDGRAGAVGTLVKVWQANAAGRYVHRADRHPAPLDANFSGAGRCLTDGDGGVRVRHDQTWRLSAWRSQGNVWRPAHVHFSLFGPGLRDAAGDPDVLPRRPAVLQAPIFNSVRDPAARER